MTTAEWVIAIIVFVLAGGFLVLGIRHFTERGFLLNNAYLYASRATRETMDKKPYYRQSAVVLCLVSGIFAILGLSLVLRNDRILLLEILLVAAVIVYALASAVRIGKRSGK